MKLKLIFLFLLVFLCTAQVAFSTVKTMDREYVPIVRKTDVAPLYELTINEWTASLMNPFFGVEKTEKQEIARALLG